MNLFIRQHFVHFILAVVIVCTPAPFFIFTTVLFPEPAVIKSNLLKGESP